MNTPLIQRAASSLYTRVLLLHFLRGSVSDFVFCLHSKDYVIHVQNSYTYERTLPVRFELVSV